MKASRTENQPNLSFRVILLGYVITMIFWILVQNLDVYRFAIVGALYEILWLPMLATIILLPSAAFYFWYKDKFNINSIFFYLLLVFVFTTGVSYFLISE
ncbi:hypothetical protein B0I10_105195 [Flavobacterium lacus]|uniref:Uncharacterized protein n=1 Tax=Flavobacterium lacus TaxID=1353778 RepID=A0A328WQF2_9FLAO|nr:hypothetical protein B0I10_105195 [Flavobacterium lacus]